MLSSSDLDGNLAFKLSSEPMPHCEGRRQYISSKGAKSEVLQYSSEPLFANVLTIGKEWGKGGCVERVVS